MFIPRTVVLACFGIFTLMGALQALYGPLIPSLRSSFLVSATTAGLIMSAHFLGATLGIFGFGLLAKTFGYKNLLLGSLGLLTLSCLALFVSSSWSSVLGVTLILGLGYGGLTAGINELFAYGFANRSAAMLNLVNSAFGIGATLGPLGLALSASASFKNTFLSLGIICIPLLILLGSSDWQGRLKSQTAPSSQSPRTLILLAFASIIFIYGLLEAGASAWQVTHLNALGFSDATSNGLKATFWACFTLGRFITAPLTLRIKPKTITLAVVIAAALLMFASYSLPLGFLLYPLTGLLYAPIYTCVLAWFADVGEGQAGSAAPIMAAGLFGSVLAPPAIGALIEWQTALIVPAVLGITAVILSFVLLLTRRLVAP